jgi:hypothetical protein
LLQVDLEGQKGVYHTWRDGSLFLLRLSTEPESDKKNNSGLIFELPIFCEVCGTGGYCFDLFFAI